MICKYWKKCKGYESNSNTCTLSCDRNYCGKYRGFEEKKSKLNIFLLLLLGIFMIGMVSAVECGSTPTAGCTITANTTFNTGTYYLNGTANAIAFSGNGLYLDCNGSTIVGNGSASTNGIVTNGWNTNTIKNCTIYNYEKNINIVSSKDNNISGNNIRNVRTSGNTGGIYIQNSNRTEIEYNNFYNVSTSIFCTVGCLNSTIIGNNFSISTNSIRLYNANNSLITSNIFDNVTRAVFLEQGSFNNEISYNSILNSNYLILYDGFGTTQNGINITSNYVNNTRFFMRLQNASDININNNNINLVDYVLDASGYFSNINFTNNIFNSYKNDRTVYTIFFRNINTTDKINILVYNNSFTNISQSGVYITGNISNLNISNNRFYLSYVDPIRQGEFIVLDGLNGNANIENNIFNQSSIQLNIIGYSNSSVKIKNNIFDDATGNGDSYNGGIGISNSRNILIDSNNYTRMGCYGILAQGTNNLTIINNNFSYNLQASINKKVNCAYESPTAIDLASNWKTWITDATETPQDNITKLLQYSPYNVNISGNSFYNFPIKLRASNPINLTQDISDYYFKSFATPTYLMPRQDYYISNDYQTVFTTFNETNNNPVSVRNILGVGWMGSTTTIKVQFIIDKNYLYYKNINQSNTYGLNLYNLTNSLIVYDNQTSIPVYGTNQEINLTLAPSQYVYVYTNTTTICNELGDCNMTFVPPFNSYWNETADGSLNLTFTDNDVNFLTKWYNWLVDGISQLAGYGQNVFTYVFHLNANDNNATVVMSKSEINGSRICYQETANVSTACGGLSTGSYSSYNILFPSNFALMYDGSYSTGAAGGSPSNSTAIFYVNYTIPTNTNSITWRTRTPNQGLSGVNNTIYSNCSSGNVLVLKAETNTNSPTDDNVTWFCYGDSEWNIIYIDLGQNAIYEEGIYWNLTTFENETNTTFLVIENISAPTITLNYPTALINYGALNQTLQLNFTATDSNLDKVWYNYNGTNVTIAGAVSGVYNISNITLSTKKNVTIYANDTAGNINATTFSWDYRYFETNTSFNTPVLATSSQTFRLIGEKHSTVTGLTARLFYNGVATASIVSTSGNNVNFTNSFEIPAGSATRNFFWEITATTTNGTFIFNTTAQTQVVNNISFSLCTVPTGLAYNFTTYDTETNLPLNSTFEATFSYYAAGGSGQVLAEYNYQNLSENRSNYLFCLNSSGLNVTIDAFISYGATGYDKRDYIIDDGIIGNFTVTIPLFLTQTLLTDVVTFTLEDQNYDRISGALVTVQKWNVGTNTYSTIGMFTTSSSGTGIMDLELYNTWYRAIVTINGVIVHVTDIQKLGSTDWPITINLGIQNPYDLFGTISQGLEYDNTTQIVTYSWADSSGYVNTACLTVRRPSGSGYTILYNDCVDTVAGSINYQFLLNGTYEVYGTVYLTAEYGNISQVGDFMTITIGTPEITQVSSPYGKVISFIIIGTSGLVGVSLGSPILGIFLLIGGMWGASMMGWLKGIEAIIWGIITVAIVILARQSRRGV